MYNVNISFNYSTKTNLVVYPLDPVTRNVVGKGLRTLCINVSHSPSGIIPTAWKHNTL